MEEQILEIHLLKMEKKIRKAVNVWEDSWKVFKIVDTKRGF